MSNKSSYIRIYSRTSYTKAILTIRNGKKKFRHTCQEKSLDRDLTLVNKGAPQKPASEHVKQGIKTNKLPCVIRKRNENDRLLIIKKTFRNKKTLKIKKTGAF